MKITLDIKDSRFNTFLAFIKTLDYVSVSKEQDIPNWHKDIIDQRLASYKENPDQTLDFDQAMDDIEKDL